MTWIDLAILFAGWAVGNIVFNAFGKHLPASRRIAKLVAMLAVLTLIAHFAGRAAMWGVVALLTLGIAVVHAWWLPRRGINGLTAEPYEKYLELIGRGKGAHK